MAKVSYPSAKQDQFVVRFPDGLRDRIRDAAEANSRSMNSEIISALEKAYPDRKAQLGQALRVIEDEIDDAPEEKRPHLMQLRKELVDELMPYWFEPLEKEDEDDE